MATPPPVQTPNGVLPHICVSDAAAAIDFYTAAFGAREEFRMPADDGKRLMHARLAINGGVLMLNDDFPEYNNGKSSIPGPDAARGVVLHLQVSDCDATFNQAVAAGATPKMPPADMFWGDRYGHVVDPFGHTWSIGSPLAKAAAAPAG